MPKKICLQCQSEQEPIARFCSHCGSRFPEEATAAPPSEPDDALPEGWQRYQDPWNGFALEHPLGWEVRCARNVITVREERAGDCLALLWPLQLPQPMSLQQIAGLLVEQARRTEPTFTAWQRPESTPDCLLLRTRAQRGPLTLEGSVTILLDGSNALISGFHCPAPISASHAPILGRILSTYRLIPPMPRLRFQEPQEGAFALCVPPGWSVQGFVNRNNIGGAAMPQFTVRRDPQGLALAVSTMASWMFNAGMPGMWDAFSGMQSRPYLPAPQFAAQFVAPMMQSQQDHFRVEEVYACPDWVPYLAAEIAKAGIPPQSMEITAAMLVTTYTEAGVSLRQKTGITVQRGTGPAAFMMGMGSMWTGQMGNYYRAPITEFDAQEPILAGILDSYRVNPVWEQNELMRNQQAILWKQQDTLRRTREISQTLHETSDIITSGYWHRQEVYDQLSHNWSNVILGRQDVVDDSGTLYSVPSGYDQYWRDNMNNLHTGTWLANPDPTWHRLEPTGH